MTVDDATKEMAGHIFTTLLVQGSFNTEAEYIKLAQFSIVAAVSFSDEWQRHTEHPTPRRKPQDGR